MNITRLVQRVLINDSSQAYLLEEDVGDQSRKNIASTRYFDDTITTLG